MSSNKSKVRPNAAIVFGFVLAFVCATITAFNVDTVNYIRHEGEVDSMFGFSVALHQEQQRSWIIVGAPLADTSRIQAGVQRGGAVYRCDIAEDNRCRIIPFDSEGNHYNERHEQVDTKSNQWFGATVSSAGINGPLVACAPRYVFHGTQPRKVVRVEPVGTCYLAKNNFTTYTEYSPCRTMFWGYHKQGSCQAGFSAAITKDGDRLFVGAPGSWYWQGQVYSINTDEVYPFKPPRYGQYGEGQTYSYDLNNQKSKVYATGESTAAVDDSYFGYSSATGDFRGDGQQGVAVGMPRGAGLLGKVCIYSWNMTPMKNITGEQIGAYFGYSIAVVDVDGDKLVDLVIGAPMYTEPNNEGKYEMGRIYIVFQDKDHSFDMVTTRDGLNSRARFGLSLTSLDDINLDGYGDFAVGAPYDGPNGRGAVYIYHGSKEGPLEKPSQVIFAEDIVGTGFLSTFGFSLSGGIDLDGNMYPDLVVGAYEANKAIVFKSRPVAVVEATTTFDPESKLISLDDKRCALRDGKKVTCTVINSCLKYNGVNLPIGIDIDVSWIVDAKKSRNPRMFFLNEEGKNIRNSSIRLSRGKTECRAERVYIVDNIRDKLTPLEVEMRFNMRENYYPGQQRRRRATLEPVIDQNRGTIERDSINIQKNCGPDNVCIPDLRLSIKTVDTYILGSKDLLVFEILVSNYGEDAFEAGFFMTVPPGLNFRKIERVGDARDTPITCTAPSASTNNTLKCDIGNPLPRDKVAHFKVILLPAQKQGMAPTYAFYMEANSTNAESDGTGFDNVIKKEVGILVETNLSVKGVSIDEEILYNTTDCVALENATNENQIGPQVVHIYEIRNGGPSTIEEAEVFFLWPYKTVNGDALLYLLNQPETTKNMQCEWSAYANQRNLVLDRSLVEKSFLVSQGAIERSSSSSSSSSWSASSSSSGHASSGHASGGGRVFSAEEERRRLDEEENKESSGDASDIHRQRAHQAAQEQFGTGNIGGFDQSSSSSWRASAQNSGPVITYSASRNRTTFRDNDGRVHVTEFSTESYGNLRNQQTSHGSQHGGQNNVHLAGIFGGGGSSSSSGSSGSISGSSGASSVRHLEDFSAEGSVNQDISSVQSRANAQAGGRRRMMSQQDGEPLRPDLITGVSQLDKIGSSGNNNFQVGAFEVNSIGTRDNADEEIRQRGNAASAGLQYGGGSYHQTSGGSGGFGRSGGSQNSQSSSFQQSSSGGSSGSSSRSSHSTGQFSSGQSATGGSGYTETKLGPTGEPDIIDHFDDDYYDYGEQSDNQLHVTPQQLPPQHVPAQHIPAHHLSPQQLYPDQQGFRHYQRLRRDLSDSTNFNDAELRNHLSCNSSECAYIRCTTKKLETDSSAWIALRLRLVTQTVKLVAPNMPLNLTTMVVSRVSKVPYIGEPHEKPLKVHEVKIRAIPIPEPKPDIVPLWIIILSACIGVIILLLLIYLLYKCGFFNRTRPDHSQERQPLNRNNGYHGDERL